MLTLSFLYPTIWLRGLPILKFFNGIIKKVNKMNKKNVKQQTKISSVSPSTRNSAGLREVLFNEIDMMRSGESSPARANAVAKLSSTLIDSVRMDIEVQKHIKSSVSPLPAKTNAEDDSPSLLSHSLA